MTINYVGATEPTRTVVHHHAVLRRGLERRVGTLCDAVENGVPHEQALTVLCEYLTEEVLPHAEAEERTLYLAVTTDACGSDLVRTLTDEHSELAYLADRLRSSVDGSDAATMAEWIATLFASHAAKENDLLLPLRSSSDASLATLLSDTHRPHDAARASQGTCQPDHAAQQSTQGRHRSAGDEGACSAEIGQRARLTEYAEAGSRIA